MQALSAELAFPRDVVVGALPFAVGLAMVAALIAAVVVGRRRRLREPAPPKEPQRRAGAWHTRQEYGAPTPEDHGPGHQDDEPVGYEHATREPEEVPRDSRRRRPHQIRDYPGPRT